MTRIDDDLDAIAEHLVRLDRRILLEALRAPASPETVRQALESVALPPSVELESIYAWRDGVDSEAKEIGDLVLFPGFYLCSTEEAVANYRAFVASDRWSIGWYPLFADGGGDFLYVDLTDGGRVSRFEIQYPEQELEYESISDLVSTIRAGYDEGIFYLDADNYLDMDDDEFRSVARRMNPTIEWWMD